MRKSLVYPKIGEEYFTIEIVSCFAKNLSMLKEAIKKAELFDEFGFFCDCF